LHYAVDLQNEEIIKCLVSRGADPNLKDSNGSAPIDEVDRTEVAYGIMMGEKYDD
jgi:ankyrin repeat protein